MERYLVRKSGNFRVGGAHKQRKTKMEKYAVPFDMPSQSSMATFDRTNAESLVSRLEPFKGHEMVLYGGGGNDSDLVILKDVHMEHPRYYINEYHQNLPSDALNVRTEKGEFKNSTTGQMEPYMSYEPANAWVVVPTLKKIGKASRYDAIWSKGIFEPHLGSWKLALVKERPIS